ncbi:hypothetical protein EV702DRAFT_970267, partial [Suillus placidus]
GLGVLELSGKEWALVKQLCDVLKVSRNTLFLWGTPNLAIVIPAMDHIDTVLTNGIINSQLLDPAIRTALHLAKKTLNRYYYSLTDKSETYRIAMGMSFCSHLYYRFADKSLAVLHPRHKLEYFKTAGWEDDWIATAHCIVRNTYERSYTSHSTGATQTLEDSGDPIAQVRHFIFICFILKSSTTG